jgi:hypothetical protein
MYCEEYDALIDEDYRFWIKDMEKKPMDQQWLDQEITEIKETGVPKYGRTYEGYTLKSGAPTQYMVKLDNEKRWRRIMIWQFSNTGTFFVKINRESLIVPSWKIGQAIDKVSI